MEASIGGASALRDGNRFNQVRALNPRKPDAITVPRSRKRRKSGGGGKGQAQRFKEKKAEIYGKEGIAVSESGALSEQDPQAQQYALRQGSAEQQLAAENAELDLEIAQSLSGDKKELAKGEMANKLFETQDKQIKNMYKAAKLTVDPDGNSTFAGEMWDSMRSFDGKTSGSVGQFYTGEDGDKRFRVMRNSARVEQNGDGAYMSLPDMQPVMHQGKPVDFSVDAMESMINPKAEPDPEYGTNEAGEEVMIQGGESQTVKDEQGGALKLRADNEKDPASVQETDQLFQRMKGLPENEGKDDNQLWMEAWNKSNAKTSDSPEKQAADFYEDIMKKLLPDDGYIDPEQIKQAEKTAEELTNHYKQNYLGGSKSSGGKQTYKTKNEVRAAFKDGTISREEAKKIITDNGLK